MDGRARPGQNSARPMNRLAITLGMLFVMVWAAVAGVALGWPSQTTTVAAVPAASVSPPAVSQAAVTSVPTTTTTTTRPPAAAFPVTADQVGRPYSEKVDGLVTFRGNPTRSYYGKGPVPKNPVRPWSTPERA